MAAVAATVAVAVTVAATAIATAVAEAVAVAAAVGFRVWGFGAIERATPSTYRHTRCRYSRSLDPPPLPFSWGVLRKFDAQTLNPQALMPNLASHGPQNSRNKRRKQKLKPETSKLRNPEASTPPEA